MIKRSFDAGDLQAVMHPHMEGTIGFEPTEWIEDQRNIALTDGEGSYNLVEYDRPGVYFVHTFYKRRGRAAREMLREAIRYGFTNYPLEILVGLTPVENKPACWMARQGGFKGHGIVDTIAGPMELFMLTRAEYEGVTNE